MGEVTGDLAQRAEEEIAETVALQPFSRVKAVLKEAREQVFIF